jgi:ribosomal protein S18 acetylase RimI-like enzyme
MPSPAPPPVRRPAVSADQGLLQELLLDSRPELSFLEPQLRDQVVELQVRAQQREYAVAHPRATHEILVADGVDVGRLVLDEAPDSLRVVDLSVARDHRGRGIGSAVLREVIAEADAGGRAVRLSVWSANSGARRLYESLGFAAEAVGSADGHVEMTRSRDVPAVRR